MAKNDPLSVEQQQAAGILAEGKTAREIVIEVDVDFATLATWQADPYFVAEVNRQRKEAWGSAHDRLRGLVNRAVETLEEAADHGDVRAAVEILKAAGVYGKVSAPVGEVDPELVMVREAEAWAKTEIGKEGGFSVSDRLEARDREPELARKRLQELRAATA